MGIPTAIQDLDVESHTYCECAPLVSIADAPSDDSKNYMSISFPSCEFDFRDVRGPSPCVDGHHLCCNARYNSHFAVSYSKFSLGEAWRVLRRAGLTQPDVQGCAAEPATLARNNRVTRTRGVAAQRGVPCSTRRAFEPWRTIRPWQGLRRRLRGQRPA